MIALALGCAGEEPTGTAPTTSDTEVPTTDSGSTVPPPFDPVITTTDNGDGTFTSIVQATDEVEYVYLSLSQGGVRVDEAGEWELAFRRELVALDGGVSGDGDGEAAVLEGVSLDAVRWAPLAGWFTDAEDADADGRPDGPFSGWFLYDITDHSLTPADQVYVVRDTTGAWRVRMDSYYWEDHSGWPTLTWAPITEAGPLSVAGDALRVDATGPTPVYVALAEQIALAPPDPASSDDWDVAVAAYEVATNGGTSGPGGRRAAAVDLPFDQVTDVPPDGAFAEDAAGAPAIHDAFVDDGGAVTAVPDRTFVVERPGLVTPADPDPAPTYSRLSFTGTTDDAGGLGFPSFVTGAL